MDPLPGTCLRSAPGASPCTAARVAVISAGDGIVGAEVTACLLDGDAA